jgi:hypothetical protein
LNPEYYNAALEFRSSSSLFYYQPFPDTAIKNNMALTQDMEKLLLKFGIPVEKQKQYFVIFIIVYVYYLLILLLHFIFKNVIDLWR